jgi:hypothetical protein
VASHHIGLQVQSGDAAVVQRLAAYAAVARRTSPDPTAAAQRAAGLLGGVIRSAAETQGVIDSFVAIAGLTAFALMLVVAHRPAPIGPASHLPLFSRQDPNP